MDAPAKKSFVYVLRCPVTDSIRYVGLTTRPKSRKSFHRCVKPNPSREVDRWTSQLAERGTPAEFEIVATLSPIEGVGIFPVYVEASVIAYCRKSGYQLFNADMDEVRRRPKPDTDSKIIGLIIETRD